MRTVEISHNIRYYVIETLEGMKPAGSKRVLAKMVRTRDTKQ